MDSTLVEMFRHNLWANLRLLDACSTLTPEQLEAETEGTYGRIQNTLVHLLAAEGHYVTLLTGVKPERPLSDRDPLPDIDVLRQYAENSGKMLIEIAQEDPYETTLKVAYQGEDHDLRAVVPLVQAIHHANEHRTHVVTILSQLGQEPPELSVWAYDDETSR
ncbi:DinB family protein [Candidatus Leptofilum sp.]|uniref:DinB family protein n=1 Tax=Candidatus Leptofilum sp. TaxID=3241576 RepID=UPI003B5C095B